MRRRKWKLIKNQRIQTEDVESQRFACQEEELLSEFEPCV